MRTTLTLEDDVVYGLKQIHASDPKLTFKDIVNETLRKGLNGKNPPRKKFKVRSFPMGLRKDLNFDKIEDVLDILDGVHRR